MISRRRRRHLITRNSSATCCSSVLFDLVARARPRRRPGAATRRRTERRSLRDPDTRGRGARRKLSARRDGGATGDDRLLAAERPIHSIPARGAPSTRLLRPRLDDRGFPAGRTTQRLRGQIALRARKKEFVLVLDRLTERFRLRSRADQFAASVCQPHPKFIYDLVNGPQCRVASRDRR